MTVPVLSNRDARRLFLHRHLMLRPGSGTGTGSDLDAVLHDLGFVQLDSVNTLARAHDLILWSRRRQFRPPALMAAVARRRSAFEHWTHDAAIIPMDFYPMWRLKSARDAARMSARWNDDARAQRHAEMDKVLRHIADHGAVSTREIGGDAAPGSSGWWDWSPSKTALNYLWRRGDLAVCHRRGFRKFYDLSERVIPTQARNAHIPDDRIIDWAMSEALARLGFGTPGELAAFFDIVTNAEARDWADRALAARRVRALDVETATGTLRRCLTTDAILDGVADLPEPTDRVRLLSPFDPALRDRSRAETLFGFRYRIEIFVPEAQRRYGYYVFPVMQGDRLIGRIDAKRDGTRLCVRAFWPERGIRMGSGRRAALMSELERVCGWAELDSVDWSDDWLRAPAE